MYKYILILLMLLPSLVWGQLRTPSATGGANDSVGVYITSAWEYIYPAFMRPGTNVTFVRDNDTLYVSSTGGTDTIYVKFGDTFGSDDWLASGDTLFIDTLATDSTLIKTWNFVNDSTGIAAFGFVAGAHTVLNDTLLGTNEAAALYQPLEATLTDIADGTIAENLVNTANPWADNEIASSGTWNGKADSSINIIAGSGLNGGGNLQANRTLNADSGFVAGVARDSGFVEDGDLITIKASPAASNNDLLLIDTGPEPDSFYYNSFGGIIDTITTDTIPVADKAVVSDSTDLTVFDTDDLAEGSSNKYDQALPDSGNWSTAYGWGDHSSQNYLDNDDANVDTAAWNAAEANTLSDSGTYNGTEGFGLAAGKTGTALKVKGLIEGDNITITTSADSGLIITGAAGGSGTTDSSYINDGTQYGPYTNDMFKIKEGQLIDIVRHDSTDYDVFLFGIKVDSFYTTEDLEDTVGAMVSDNTETGITVTYQDGDGTIDFEVAVSSSEITDQTITGADVDSTSANFVFNDAYRITSAEADSAYMTKGYIVGTFETIFNVELIGDDTANFKTAYGWGDHSTQNYLDNDDANIDTTGWNAAVDSVAAWDNGVLAPSADPVFTGSMQVPNGANPTVDAEGELAYETDDECFRIYDGSANRAIPTVYRFDALIFLPDSINAYDSPIPLLTVDTLWAPFGIKILALTMATDVSTTDTVAFWEYASPDDGSPSLIDTVIVAAGYEQKETTITDSDIAANSYIYLDLSEGTALDWIKVAGAYYIKTGD